MGTVQLDTTNQGRGKSALLLKGDYLTLSKGGYVCYEKKKMQAI
jgi:hypothetical protein